MINNQLYLLDKDFLLSIIQQQQRDVYVRITALDINNIPVETIEGQATGGSINIDGNSSVRRTCSINMITDNININDFYWGIKTRFILEIGLYNYLMGEYSFKKNNKYPEIVWFPQGQFLISSFNTSLSTNSCSISLSGKDKMCLLNGDLGGQLYASIDFGAEDYEEDAMEEIIPPKILSSKDLLSSDYYIKITPKQETYYSYDPRYVFIPTKNGSYYYSETNKGYKNKDFFDNRDGQPDQYYDIYGKNQNIVEYFTKEKTLDYKPNTFYYQNTEGLYILDTQNNKREKESYFSLVPLYVKIANLTKKKIPLKKIIREAIHTYANEPYYNIIINDLDDYGLEQLTYKGDKILYAIYSNGNFIDLILQDANESLENVIKTNNFYFFTSPEELGTALVFKDNTFAIPTSSQDDTRTKYYVMKITYGMDIGYQITDLTYPGDLISNIGDSLTSILDKIKTMLSEFEYFYDINGRFIFQKKKTYVQSFWSQLTKQDTDVYVNYLNSSDQTVLSLNDNLLISSIQNTPALNNVRNDFIVWGKRKTASGAEIPIHVRFAIDKKPVYYKTLEGKVYFTKDHPEVDLLREQGQDYLLVDWREIIYQMALDYFKGQGCSEEKPIKVVNTRTILMTSPDRFLYWVGQQNPDYYPTGYTGYEQYYTDMQGFWRQLYNPEYIPKLEYPGGKYERKYSNGKWKWEWQNPKVKDYVIDYYFDKNVLNNNDNNIPSDIYNSEYAIDDKDNPRLYWHCNVFENPTVLNFWIDFLDSGLDLANFSIPQIGDRTKVINETSKNTVIIYPEVPEFLIYYIENVEEEEENKEQIDSFSAYTKIQIPKGYLQYFDISYHQKSLKDQVDELLYQYGYCVENITATTLPIYFLEPNSLIYLQDDETKIEGNYIVERISISLNYNGMMSITATKAPRRII